MTVLITFTKKKLVANVMSMPNPDHPEGLWAHQEPLTREQEKILEEIYYKRGLKFGLAKIYEVVRQKNTGKHIYRAQIERWLKDQEIYQLYKRPTKFTSTKKIIAKRPGLLQMDTLVLGNMAFNGFKYIVNVIDVHSRYAWAIPMKTLVAEKVAAKLAKLFLSMKKRPSAVMIDGGVEWMYPLGDIDPELSGVKYIKSIGRPTVQSVVERFNQNIRRVISKNWNMGNRNWVAMLPEICQMYNCTRHSATDKTPYSVYMEDESVSATSRETTRTRKPKAISVGAHVRLRVDLKRSKLTKGQPYWSREIFRVTDIKRGGVSALDQYRVALVDSFGDESGRPVRGLFNATLLQEISDVQREREWSSSEEEGSEGEDKDDEEGSESEEEDEDDEEGEEGDEGSEEEDEEGSEDEDEERQEDDEPFSLIPDAPKVQIPKKVPIQVVIPVPRPKKGASKPAKETPSSRPSVPQVVIPVPRPKSKARPSVPQIVIPAGSQYRPRDGSALTFANLQRKQSR
jgi:hypothetical protein